MQRVARLVFACSISVMIGTGMAANQAFAQTEAISLGQSGLQSPNRLYDHNIVQSPEIRAEHEYLKKEFPNEYMEIQRLAQMDNMLNRRIHMNLKHIKDVHQELQEKIMDAKQKQPIDTKELNRLEQQMRHFEDKYKRFRKSIHPHMLQLKSLFEQRRTLHEEYVKHYTNHNKKGVKQVLNKWIENGKETIMVKQRILKRMQGESVL